MRMSNLRQKIGVTLYKSNIFMKLEFKHNRLTMSNGLT